MRRSAAPSQLQGGKRGRFTVPYKTPLLNSPLVREETALQQSQNTASTTCFPSNTANQPQKSDMPTTSDQGSQIIHFPSKPVSTNLIGNIGLSENKKSFCGPGKSNTTSFSSPSFLRRKAVSFESVPVLPVKDLSSSEEKTDAKKNITENTSPSVSETESDKLTDNHAFSVIQTQGSVGNRHSERTPLKPCNAASKFRTPSLTVSENTRDDNVERDSQRGVNGAGSQESPTNGGVQSDELECSYFSVVWCKLSKKKHKKWEGDAVLRTRGRQVTLFDMEGKEIGKGCGYKSSELETLAEDETLTIGGKEIQVMSKLSSDQFTSGKCFSSSGSGVVTQPAKSTPVHSKSFVNPVIGDKGASGSVSCVSRMQSVAPRFDPLAPGALVMPSPSPAHQWQHNKHGAPVVEVVVDPHLSYHLRPHQRDGIAFLYQCVMGMRDYPGAGAILADDMGLGKTLQCISLIWTLLKQGMYGGKPAIKKVLIITPGSLVKNWSAEFRKWLGAERLQVFAVSGDSKVQDYTKTAVYPVLIISYEMFVRGYEVIKQLPFDLVVCDEGHRLKNSAIKTTSLISSLDTRRRVVLSGTPIQNDLQEFFAVVDFCNPGVLGSSAAFRRVYEEPIVMSRQPGAVDSVLELGKERARELSRLTSLFVLRRTQEVNNKYLPPKVELVVFCQPSALQVGVYRELLRSSVVRSCLWGRGQGSGLGAGAGSPHLLAIAALKQVCNHPRLIAPKLLRAAHTTGQSGEEQAASSGDELFAGLVDQYLERLTGESVVVEESGKLATLAVLLKNIFSACAQDKVVLVSNHTKTLDLLQTFCGDQGYECVRLDGHTPTAQRQQIVTRFNSAYGREKIFLLSSKAGGVGLNLVGASRLILYDIDWNPANDLQAMARVWRDGQKKEVHIYRLLTTGSLEEKVYQRQISKQGLSGAVMDMRASDFQFSQEDLKDLFSFSEGVECETHDLLGCECGGSKTEQKSNASSLPARPCQLGKKVTGKKSPHLSMAQLLDWQHLRGASSHVNSSWCLDNTKDLVTFLFWHKTNADAEKEET